MIKKLLIIALVLVVLFIGFFFWFFPTNKYSGEIEEVATKYEVDKKIIYSIVKIESDFNPKAESYVGAQGLMQVMPVTAKWILEDMNGKDYEDYDILDPKDNLEIGTLYLRYLLKRYDGDIEKVLVAYNAGPERVKNDEWKKIKETRNYVIKYSVARRAYDILLRGE